MFYLTAVVLALTIPSSWQLLDNTRNAIIGGITKESVAVTKLLEQGVINAASNQCTLLRKVIRMDYGQFDTEDKLQDLTLDYIVQNVIKIKYYLKTAAERIPKSNEFDPKKPLYVYIHGYFSKSDQDTYWSMSEALASIGQCNVLALDSSTVLSDVIYPRAATYTKYIGEKLGEVLAAITKCGTKPQDIHLIGHSLGAHIAGHVGKKFYELTGRKIGRISGLDPAGPCFTKLDAIFKLQSSDADYVDAIHTNAGVFGLPEPVGHVDFYPNGGGLQPGCPTQSCNHGFCALLYIESITNPYNFPAVKCDSWKDFRDGKCKDNNISYMGFGCSNNTRGIYYLQTFGEPTYGRGSRGMQFENNEGLIKNVLADIPFYKE